MNEARIHLLEPFVADAIAAGEVIERPASVVKELCENAVDAGASRIEVLIERGGLVRIRVSDDGRGIHGEDLPLAVARHATSKIAGADDLARIASLGFRGEALASIAAVADLTIVSRIATAPGGSRLRVRSAQVVEQGPAAAAVGTTVEVHDLFVSTPARLRFLRSSRTEAAAAARVVSDLALSHPEVAFTCRVDGRLALRSPGGTLRDAARAVLGTAAAGELVDVVAAGEIAVTGLVCEPRAHRAGREGLVLVVNTRRVHNRALVVAVEEAYRSLVPSGRHPWGVVTVSLDPNEVDVNVHPTKREVRFRDERAVFAAVQRACWHALQHAQPQVGMRQWEAVMAGGQGALAVADEAPPAAAVHVAPARGTGTPSAAATTPVWGGPSSPGMASLAPLRALGQAGSAWLIAESPRGVVLVDPHAAHEKVLYSELLAAWETREQAAAFSQLLLIPAVVECDADRMARLEANADLVLSCGFELAPFGPGLVRCTAVPAACAGGDVVGLLGDLLDALDSPSAAGEGLVEERRHRLAALLACHAAVRFGDVLDPAEQQRLLDRLVGTPGATTCPHGRPTTIVLEDEALRRAFRRPVQAG